MFFNFASIASAAVLAFLSLGLLPTRSLTMHAPSGISKTHKVTVGAWGQLRYNPEFVHAKLETTSSSSCKFLHPKNHTVTESSFGKPCSAIDGGFRTGFVPVAEEDKHDLPIRKFKVTDEKPHWFYCGQIGHCPAGMVFAVNPPNEGNTFEKFQSMAKESGGK
ncbi:hypothetical protein RHS01_09674 [Rhizoctonia solani]|uniref:Phytocyanin domain-containing protein n=1 Tax=Rhizoctonia solani TaxID=456999 RepID=A0A8H7I6L7_9AGAM|nr:hypothetical protein RHS01_09674 [Rhizoctonia solani]